MLTVTVTERSRLLWLLIYWAALAATGLTVQSVSSLNAIKVAPVCLVAAYLGWVITRPNFRLRDLSAGLIAFCIICGFFLPATLAWILSAGRLLSQLVNQGYGLIEVGISLFIIICCVASLFAVKWSLKYPDWLFCVTTLGSALILKVFYVWLIQVDPVSDFRSMWSLTSSVLGEGIPYERINNHLATGLHFERIIPYFLPLRILFGADRLAFAIPNAVATIACSYIVYLLAAGWFGRIAGRITLVISLLAVEPILAAGIPTHDIPGALYCLVTIACFVYGYKYLPQLSIFPAILLSLLLGLLLTASDLQRGTTPFLLLAFILILLASLITHRSSSATDWWSPARHAIHLIVLPVIVMSSINHVLESNNLAVNDEMSDYWTKRGIAAHTDLWSEGTYGYAKSTYYQNYQLDTNQWDILGKSKLITQLKQSPGAWPDYLARKTARIYRLGDQLGFYLNEPRLAGNRSLDRRLRKALAQATLGFRFIFLILVLAGLALTMNRRTAEPLALFPALYFAILSGALIFLFQTQPRYLYQIWYIGAIYAGALFAPYWKPSVSSKYGDD